METNTLHKAIEIVLRERRERALTVREITDTINVRELYLRKIDDNPLTTNQVSARIKKHPKLFEVDRNNSPHLISLK